MSNMSYCRFENTAGDLLDCFRALRDGEAEDDDLNQHEQRAKRQLLRTAAQMLRDVADRDPEILEELGIEVGDDFEVSDRCPAIHVF